MFTGVRSLTELKEAKLEHSLLSGNESYDPWEDGELKYEDVAVNGEQNGVETKILWRKQVLAQQTVRQYHQTVAYGLAVAYGGQAVAYGLVWRKKGFWWFFLPYLSPKTL